MYESGSTKFSKAVALSLCNVYAMVGPAYLDFKRRDSTAQTKSFKPFSASLSESRVSPTFTGAYIIMFHLFEFE